MANTDDIKNAAHLVELTHGFFLATDSDIHDGGLLFHMDKHTGEHCILGKVKPNGLTATKQLATFIPQLDALFINTKGEPYLHHNKVNDGALYSPTGIIIAAKSIYAKSPFSSIFQKNGTRMAGSPVFMVDITKYKDEYYKKRNAIILKKNGDEYQWAYLFPFNGALVDYDHEHNIIMQYVSAINKENPHFSLDSMSFVKGMDTYEYRHSNSIWTEVHAYDEEDARKIVDKTMIDYSTGKVPPYELRLKQFQFHGRRMNSEDTGT